MRSYRGKPGIYDVPAGSKEAELEVENLSLNFGGVAALRNVDLSVRTGEFVAVIGPNGAGKTSLLNTVTGYYRADKGRIRFNGEDITRTPTHDITRKGIGRTFQNIELFPGMTVLSNMMLARHLFCRYRLGPAGLFLPAVRKEEVRHRRIVEEIIDFLEMQAIRNTPVGSLPYGQRKRVELGRALALDPRLLILDEPFAGMNMEEKEDMVRFLVELNGAWNQTMILVEHDMSIVMSISQRVIVLNFGEKLAEGTPGEVQNDPEVIRAYLGEAEAI